MSVAFAKKLIDDMELKPRASGFIDKQKLLMNIADNQLATNDEEQREMLENLWNYILQFPTEPSKEEAVDTVDNNAILLRCKCPKCGRKLSRTLEEEERYCRQCGQKLHVPAFSEAEKYQAMSGWYPSQYRRE